MSETTPHATNVTNAEGSAVLDARRKTRTDASRSPQPKPSSVAQPRDEFEALDTVDLAAAVPLPGDVGEAQ
ncbi:MAG: hypothetical protein AAGK78_02265, partial [Planctomycetota bacterium]